LKEILRKRYGGELEMWKAKEAERVIDIRRYFGCDIFLAIFLNQGIIELM
jgi:hypothetical protein